MTNHAQSERSALCDLFDRIGPDAPTLCEGWSTRDLAAHLVIRERRPDAALGILVPFAAAYGERVRRRVADREWSDLVRQVRTGPPSLSPMRLGAVDALVNTNEFFVHHEDVRRARPDWAPRELDEGLVDALWAALGRMARMTLRRAGVGVVLDSDSDRRARIIDRQPTVEIRGPVGELVMFCNGRQDHARVELDGPTDAVARLSGANLGI